MFSSSNLSFICLLPIQSNRAAGATAGQHNPDQSFNSSIHLHPSFYLNPTSPLNSTSAALTLPHSFNFTPPPRHPSTPFPPLQPSPPDHSSLSECFHELTMMSEGDCDQHRSLFPLSSNLHAAPPSPPPCFNQKIAQSAIEKGDDSRTSNAEDAPPAAHDRDLSSYLSGEEDSFDTDQDQVPLTAAVSKRSLHDDDSREGGFWIQFGPWKFPVRVYCRTDGTLALCLLDVCHAIGCPRSKLNSFVSNLMTRHGGERGEPFSTSVWHAQHLHGGGGYDPILNMARASTALRMVRGWWKNAHIHTRKNLPGMKGCFREMEVLAAKVSHAQRWEGNCENHHLFLMTKTQSASRLQPQSQAPHHNSQ